MYQDLSDPVTNVGRSITDIKNKYFVTISSILSNYHGVTKDDKSWQIIIMPWLEEAARLYSLLRETEATSAQCLEESAMTDFTIPIPWDLQAFELIIGEVEWRDIIRIGITADVDNLSFLLISQSSFKKNNPIKIFAMTLWNVVSKALAIFYRPKYVVVRPYLSVLDSIRFCYKTRSLYLFDHFDPKVKSVDFNERRRFLKTILNSYPNDKFLRLFFLLLPVAHLENFKSLSERAARLPLPRMGVITANSYWFNEEFKHYAGQAICDGRRLIIIQHGSFFEVNYFYSLEHQLAVADVFITWGDPAEVEKRSSCDLVSVLALGFCKTQGLPSVVQSRDEFRERYQARIRLLRVTSYKILLICNSDCVDFMLWKASGYGTNYLAGYLNHLKRTISLLLKAGFIVSLKLYPYLPNRKSINLSEEVRSSFGDRVDFESGGLSSAINKYDVFVCTYLPQSAFLEVLHLGGVGFICAPSGHGRTQPNEFDLIDLAGADALVTTLVAFQDDEAFQGSVQLQLEAYLMRYGRIVDAPVERLVSLIEDRYC